MTETCQTILVIDDEEIIRESIGNYLEDRGYRVLKAADGQIGLDIFKREAPDMVLTDLRMPVVDGLDVLQSISELTTQTPVIVVSGTGRIGDTIRALRLGAWDYILKPIEDLSILIIAIDKSFERLRLLRENKAYQDGLEQQVAQRTIELEDAYDHLRVVSERMELALWGADLGTWDWVVATGEVVFNERATEMLGYTLGEIEPNYTAWEKLVHPDDLPDVQTLLTGHLEGKTDLYVAEYRLQHKSGEWIWILAKGRVIKRDDGGKALRVCGTHLDINDYKRAQTERERLINELEGKNAELERYTYTVSHDLKSPLVTINGFVNILQEDAMSGDVDRMKDDIKHINNATTKMSDLLNDLLELSRVGRTINISEKVSMVSLVDEVLALISFLVKESNAQVTVSPELPTVFCDRQRIGEVIQNLIENSIKYMGDQPDPKIEIGIRNDSGKPVIYVCDNGIGINPKYGENIFGLFNQLDQSKNGTGVGLAIVKRIIELHGGRIWVESEGEGKGATFCFTINPG